MTLFVDTSALYAVMSSADRSHDPAERAYRRFLADDRPLEATSYVLVETVALLQARAGLDSARSFVDRILPVLTIRWVGEEDHRDGWRIVAEAGRRAFSLVDAVTVAVMKRRGAREIFAFDPDFARYGLDVVPGR